METNEFIKLLFKKKQTVLFVIILFLILAMIITFIQPLKYAASAKLLVVQNYSPQTDAYVISRSNEYLSTVLAKVMSTNSFFQEVVSNNQSINRNYFGDDYNQQIEIWNKTITAQPLNDTGIINLTVYHTDKEQAGQIMQAVIATMAAQHKNYHGAGDQVEVRTIDQSVTSKTPVKPNIFLNLFAGLILGVVFSFVLVYLYPEEKYNVEQVLHKKSTPKPITPVVEPLHKPDFSLPVENKPVSVNQVNNNIPTARLNYQAPNFRSEEYDDLDIVRNGDMQNIFRQSNLDN